LVRLNFYNRTFAQSVKNRRVLLLLCPSRRGLAVGVMIATSFGWSGCVTRSAGIAAMETVHAVPVPTLVSPGHELAAAEAQAERDPFCFVLTGMGRSMEPVYASGTAIVVREQNFRILRVGQAVVYRNMRGRFVAHIVVTESPDGWLVAGMNNAGPDRELVTADNFVGVVLAAYASAKVTPSVGELATRHAIMAGVTGGTRTVAVP
jgi:signal peptidase I